SAGSRAQPRGVCREGGAGLQILPSRRSRKAPRPPPLHFGKARQRLRPSPVRVARFRCRTTNLEQVQDNTEFQNADQIGNPQVAATLSATETETLKPRDHSLPTDHSEGFRPTPPCSGFTRGVSACGAA